jgi:hypothetical protein
MIVRHVVKLSGAVPLYHRAMEVHFTESPPSGCIRLGFSHGGRMSGACGKPEWQL